jgi:hypothetical protein
VVNYRLVYLLRNVHITSCLQCLRHFLVRSFLEQSFSLSLFLRFSKPNHMILEMDSESKYLKYFYGIRFISVLIIVNWLIIASILTYSNYSMVDYSGVSPSLFCNKTLFHFMIVKTAFLWFVLLLFSFTILAVLGLRLLREILYY